MLEKSFVETRLRFGTHIHPVSYRWTDNFKEHQYISGFSAVTFSKRVFCPFMFKKKLRELKSGKECDGLHSLAELIFDGMIVFFFLTLNSEAFCFSSLLHD